MSTENVVTLDMDEAISALRFNKDSSVHVFRNLGGSLVGADWERTSLVDAMFSADRIEIGGEVCMRMDHAIVVWQRGAKMQHDLLFVASKPDRIAELEAAK